MRNESFEERNTDVPMVSIPILNQSGYVGQQVLDGCCLFSSSNSFGEGGPSSWAKKKRERNDKSG